METGIAESKGGKKPILLKINPGGCFSIAVDWTRNDCSVARVNMAGEIAQLKTMVLTDADTPATILGFMQRTIRPLLENRTRITGICIVAPGPLDRNAGVILNPPNFHGWSNMDIADQLRRDTGRPVFLENVANARGIAEKNMGLGEKYRNFIHIAVDEGIGASIIINNRLHLGTDGFGSELGHISIDRDGPVCGCGNVGCVELFASLPALLDRLAAVLDLGAASPFFKAGPAGRRPGWEDVLAGLEAGDTLCRNLMKKEAEFLGNAVITAINLFEPQAIILGSRIAEAGLHLTEPLTEFIRDKLFTRSFHKVPVLVSGIRNASLSGGGFLVLDHFINGDLGTYEAVLDSGNPIPAATQSEGIYR